MTKRSMIDRSIQGSAPPISYKKGGRIRGRKPQLVKVHVGEVIVPKKDVKELERLIHGKRKVVRKSSKRR